MVDAVDDDHDCQLERVPLQAEFAKNYLSTDGNFRSRKVGPPPLKPGVDYVNPQEEDQMELYGYRPNYVRTVLTWVLIVLSGGVLRLVFHWRPHWMLYWTHLQCPLRKAKKVLLVDHFLQKFSEDIVYLKSNDFPKNIYGSENFYSESKSLIKPNSDGTFEQTDSLIYFENKKVRYLWDPDLNEFVKIRGLDKKIPSSLFYQAQGLSCEEQDKRRIIYGENSIVVNVQSVFKILYQEVLEPFYVFQVFSVLIWCLDNYLYYASCIVIMSALSLTSSVIQTRRNQRQLRDTVQATDSVKVWRGGDDYEEIMSTRLVPGDVVVIPPHGCVMQCDAVLVSGNVIVNESMLTGESVPVTKTPLPQNADTHYYPKEHAKHTLFCGTKVIQTRYYGGAKVKAVVIRTGFLTAKGELVRSIMFPKPVDFKFNRHIAKFIACMAGLALIGFTYTVILKAIRHVPAYKIALKALDLITIVIPPALPAAMTIGVVFAQSRLRRAKIFCISPRSINISGCINCVCFDKTGTLTEDDLNFAEVVPVNKNAKRFDPPVKSLKSLEFGQLLISLASCHSLTIIEGNIVGDPLDKKMFDATDWHLEEPQVDDTNKYDLLAPTVVKPKDLTGGDDKRMIGILRQFPFSSSLQRMSVITKCLGASEFELYAKGSPEMITSLCDVNTIPSNFSDVLIEYTQKGYRVLALAYKPLPSMTYPKIQRAAREDLEQNLTFLGLLIMGNMLKPETTSVIETLAVAKIRSVMVTGDNMLTALSVARECSMIQPHHKVVLLEASDEGIEEFGNKSPKLFWKFSNSSTRKRIAYPASIKNIETLKKDKIHIAVTGKTFKVLRDFYPELLNKVAVRGIVFARMAPEQKQQLIEILQELGYYVGMCGDGANDCGALKAAHAGVSLSETEASVASPFTSKTPNISCVPILIREGRASLVTAFGILKYMALYSLTQFISVIILYTFYSNLTDKEFLYIDLFLITLFVTLFGRTHAYDQLNRKAPPSSLIGITPLTSIGLQVLIVTLFQCLAIFMIWQQPWYKEHVTNDPEDLASHDNLAVFSVSVFQYITLAVVFSKGSPYRKSLYTNRLFLLSLISMTALTVYLVMFPCPWLAEFFELKIADVPHSFRLLMVLLAIAHFILAVFTEAFLVDYIVFKKFTRWFKLLSPSDDLYKKINSETKKNLVWLRDFNSPTDHENNLNHCPNGQTTMFQDNCPKYSPESGIWTSQASSISHNEALVNVSPKLFDSPVVVYASETKTSSPTTISSPSDSCNNSDLNISSKL